MKVGVLAVQGAFAEMEAFWRAKGADVFEIRQLADLGRGMVSVGFGHDSKRVAGDAFRDGVHDGNRQHRVEYHRNGGRRRGDRELRLHAEYGVP